MNVLKKPAVFLCFLALLSLACGSAYAEKYGPDSPLCKALTKHVPSADVAYQMGVGINGEKVVEADLEGAAPVMLPQPINIPLTADLMKILGITATSFPFDKMGRTDINLSTLTIDGDRVFYNGQLISDSQQDNLAVLCLQPDE
ncbi:MAG: hypothetical protein PHX43_06575 [Alphaproteobacteria bacterium]|nr:hypothetical protein [Alphaproteobacteria bacterium]